MVKFQQTNKCKLKLSYFLCYKNLIFILKNNKHWEYKIFFLNYWNTNNKTEKFYAMKLLYIKFIFYYHCYVIPSVYFLNEQKLMTFCLIKTENKPKKVRIQ